MISDAAYEQTRPRDPHLSRATEKHRRAVHLSTRPRYVCECRKAFCLAENLDKGLKTGPLRTSHLASPHKSKRDWGSWEKEWERNSIHSKLGEKRSAGMTGSLLLGTGR